MGELSRWEDLLKTGSEDTVKPLSRVEAILRDEDITPQSRIEKLLKEGGGGGAVLYDEYEITQNKTKIVPPVGYDGFSSVITNVPEPFTKVELYQSEYDALTPAEKTDPSKFYVIKPGSPRVYLYKWDFTKAVDPLVDEMQGQVATANNVTPIQGTGITFNENNLDENVLLVNNFNLYGKTVEIEIENISSTLYRKVPSIFGYKKINNSNWVGFDTRDNKWVCIVDSSDQTYITSLNTMSDGIYKFVFGNDNTDLKIYLNDDLIYDGYGISYQYLTDFVFIGGIGNVLNMTVKTLKIYENEEV